MWERWRFRDLDRRSPKSVSNPSSLCLGDRPRVSGGDPWRQWPGAEPHQQGHRELHGPGERQGRHQEEVHLHSQVHHDNIPFDSEVRYRYTYFRTDSYSLGILGIFLFSKMRDDDQNRMKSFQESLKSKCLIDNQFERNTADELLTSFS